MPVLENSFVQNWNNGCRRRLKRKGRSGTNSRKIFNQTNPRPSSRRRRRHSRAQLTRCLNTQYSRFSYIVVHIPWLAAEGTNQRQNDVQDTLRRRSHQDCAGEWHRHVKVLGKSTMYSEEKMYRAKKLHEIHVTRETGSKLLHWSPRRASSNVAQISGV